MNEELTDYYIEQVSQKNFVKIVTINNKIIEVLKSEYNQLIHNDFTGNEIKRGIDFIDGEIIFCFRFVPTLNAYWINKVKRYLSEVFINCRRKNGQTPAL